MNYIWYKLYRASLKSTLSKPRGLLASIVLSVILFSNIIVFNAFISKIDLFPFVFHQIKKLIPIIQIVLFAVIYLYYSGKRFLMIIKKYRVETKKHRIIQGEKGIGRFAILKLGRNIRITTRPEGHNKEYIIDYNLSQYDDDFLTERGEEKKLFIDDISIPVSEQIPIYLTERRAYHVPSFYIMSFYTFSNFVSYICFI